MLESSVFPGLYDPFNPQDISEGKNFIAITGGIQNYDFTPGSGVKENYHDSWAGVAASFLGMALSVSYPTFGDRISGGGTYIDDGFFMTAGYGVKHLNAAIGLSAVVPLGFKTKNEGISLNAGFSSDVSERVKIFISMRGLISNGYTAVMDDTSHVYSSGWPFTTNAGVKFTPNEQFNFTLTALRILSQKQILKYAFYEGQSYEIIMPEMKFKPGLSVDCQYTPLSWFTAYAGINGGEEVTDINFDSIDSDTRFGYKAGLTFRIADFSINVQAEADSRPVSGMPKFNLTTGQSF